MNGARRLAITNPESVPADAGDAIGVVSAQTPHQVLDLVQRSNLLHVVQSDGLRFEAECRAASKMINDPKHFLQHPMQTIFGPIYQTLQPFQIQVDASEKKRAPLSEFAKYIAGLGESETVTETALMVADELYTNASKNAWPADGILFQGPAVNPGTIDFFAARDQDVLAIGCRDSYGQLDLRALIARIKLCYEQGVANSILWGKGGAGIGSFMIFDSCLSYYAALDPGRLTLICITLPLVRRIGEPTKNVHLLSLPKTEE